jgi:hypothetical protein
MNDANGGEGQLRGLVQNVPLTCGGVHTQANLYVGDHVPFSLLLGRPWQCGNFVSIDECQDGTWLVFKDPHSLQITHEMLCTPDGTNPQYTFEPYTWFNSRISTSFLMTDSQETGSFMHGLSNNDLFGFSQVPSDLKMIIF